MRTCSVLAGLLVTLGSLLLVITAAGTAQARADITPLPPVWPDSFKIQFNEETYITWFTMQTSGVMYYDAARNMSRVDRENGVGDRYCGTAYPLRNTPCTHLVRDNMRFLIFPELKTCCKCCSDANGCGILRPDWLQNATYEGRDTLYGITCNKWNKAGLQNNYYWQALDETPMRIYMEYTDQMTFVHDSYRPKAYIEESVFDYPKDMDCSPSCYGICAIASPNESTPSNGLQGVLKAPLIRQVV